MYKCECCRQKSSYKDEMVFLDCNGNEVEPTEEECQNPDHIVMTVCGTCYTEGNYYPEFVSRKRYA